MAKGIMYIDGQRVPFDGETNVLSVIRKAGIEMPTFCYYSDLSVYGACRMCVVEDERGKIETSCSMKPRDGLSIRTNTARLLKHRRMILELLLASHNCSCTTCEKSGDCRLQELAMRFGVRRVRFGDSREESQLDDSSPAVVRDPSKCILCGDCVRVCGETIGMGIIDFAQRGYNMRVSPTASAVGSAPPSAPPAPSRSITRSARPGGPSMTPRSARWSRSLPRSGWPWARPSAFLPAPTPWTSWSLP